MPTRTPPARLLPTPPRHDLLTQTLERINRASNAARVRVGAGRGTAPGRAELRAIAREELERLHLPSALAGPVADRLVATGGRARFGTYQSVTLPPSLVRWPGPDRVSLPTVAGRRTIRVYVDVRRGDLRPPLEGRPVNLVFRNNEFSLHAADEPDPHDDR